MSCKTTGLPIANVFVHKLLRSGGFGMGGTHGELQTGCGRRQKRCRGRPVKVQWTREEDIGHVNGFPSHGVAKLTAALGPDGMPTAIWSSLPATMRWKARL